uniref:Putative secreted protein n=1 Tax=Anopheles marajoara TaxID=58244 RepID=A0A2M4CAP1_9DIPT
MKWKVGVTFFLHSRALEAAPPRFWCCSLASNFGVYCQRGARVGPELWWRQTGSSGTFVSLFASRHFSVRCTLWLIAIELRAVAQCTRNKTMF